MVGEGLLRSSGDNETEAVWRTRKRTASGLSRSKSPALCPGYLGQEADNPGLSSKSLCMFSIRHEPTTQVFVYLGSFMGSQYVPAIMPTIFGDMCWNLLDCKTIGH